VHGWKKHRRNVDLLPLAARAPQTSQEHEHARANQSGLKRRTHVIRIFPNEESALRLIRALAVEIHEDWIEAPRYLNIEMLREQRKQLQLLEAA
jgi:transposase-like protein